MLEGASSVTELVRFTDHPLHELRTTLRNTVLEIEIRRRGNYFSFFAAPALIFAHVAFAERRIFARVTADIVRFALTPFELLLRPGETTVFLLPLRAAMAP